MENMDQVVEKVGELLTIYGLKVIAALAIFIIGRWVARFIENMLQKVMRKKDVDEAVVSFTGSLSYAALMVFVILAALNQLGIQTTSFIAIIGAAGLAIGLALQGSLANFAAGFLMIIFKPFKVGDYIEGAGVAGTVHKIQIFTTELTTPDNKTIIIPNAKLTGDNITNYSTQGTRRVNLTASIGYGDDIDKAKKILNDMLDSDERILEDPAPTVAVVELGESSVNFVVRPWVKSSDYWGVYYDLNENIKKRFDAEGISIPFPQRDVHLYEHKGE
jgi:small conductance mechanosensitive channel